MKLLNPLSFVYIYYSYNGTIIHPINCYRNLVINKGDFTDNESVSLLHGRLRYKKHKDRKTKLQTKYI